MRYIKLFEDMEIEPEVGDWVIVRAQSRVEDHPYDDVYPFLRFSPGQIIEKVEGFYFKYFIYFHNLTFDGKPYKAENPVLSFGRDNIVYWSKNRSDVEDYIDMQYDVKKYNL